MKLVNTDNYGGDYPNEKFLQIGNNPVLIPDDERGKAIQDAMNAITCPGGNGSRYWQLVNDDYSLAPAFEP